MSLMWLKYFLFFVLIQAGRVEVSSADEFDSLIPIIKKVGNRDGIIDPPGQYCDVPAPTKPEYRRYNGKRCTTVGNSADKALLGRTKTLVDALMSATSKQRLPNLGEFVSKRQVNFILSQISVAENDDPHVMAHGGYCEELGDGRGFTFGITGFTTDTRDGYEVVKEYVGRYPKSKLSRFLPELKRLVDSSHGSGKLRRMHFCEAVAREARYKKEFGEVQLDYYTNTVLRPSAWLAKHFCVSDLPSAIELFLDTGTQHGIDDPEDLDGLPALLAATTAQFNGATPCSNALLKKNFLARLVQNITTDKKCPHNKETQKVWSESTDRTVFIGQQIAGKNDRLTEPVTYQSFPLVP